MATEDDESGGRGDHQQMIKEEMEKELAEIRARMEHLALKMQQNAKPHWVYEWPMKRKESGQSKFFWPEGSKGY